MKKIIFFIAAIIISVQISAQDKVETNTNPNAPKFAFTSDVVDYGEIIKGADGVRYFDFVNDGKEPLIISNIRSSCGCTVPEYQKTPIGPGESSQIKVKYDTKRTGPFKKTITIYSNSSEGTKILTIKGKILREAKNK